MFGANIDDKKQEATAPLLERIGTLENKVSDLEQTVSDLQNTISEFQQQMQQLTQQMAQKPASTEMPQPSADTADTIAVQQGPKIYYLGAPSADGIFRDISENEQEGKSLYELTTADEKNGTFRILNTPDAVATALISISQMVQPVCKIMGRVNPAAHEALTAAEGKARKTAEGWKVTAKADVCFN